MMSLAAWVSARVREGSTRREVILYLVNMTEKAGEKVSATTIAHVARGGQITRAPKAYAISRATDGAVSAASMLAEE